MESPSSSVSTVSSFGEYFAHNMWNRLLELLFLEQTSGVIVLFVKEIEFAQIALSFILPLICSAARKVFTILHDATLVTIACGEYMYLSICYGTSLNTRWKGYNGWWH